MSLPVPSTSPHAGFAGEAALRKVRRRVLPLLALGYGVAYIDRANVSFAALQMNRDLHFSATVYGFGAGLFFLGYAAFGIPANLMLLRVGARRWMAGILLSWGMIAMALMLVKTPVEFYVTRFLLGIAESGFFPAVVYYLNLWFPAGEKARAVSRFYVAYPISAAVMGAVAGALLSLQGRLGLAGWQWLFLVEGFPAVLLGAVFLRYLPNGPQDATWLTEAERAGILDVLEQERSSVASNRPEVADASWLVLLRDPRFWQMSIFFFLMLAPFYAYTLSQPAIFKDLTGFSASGVGFLISGVSLLAGVAMILNAWHSDRSGERYLHVGIPFVFITAGYLFGGLSSYAWVGPWLAVPALAGATIGYNASMGPQWAIPPKFMKMEHAAAGIAALNTIGILGGFVGPWWLGVAKDLTGNYERGLLTMTVPSLAAFAIMLVMRQQAAKG